MAVRHEPGSREERGPIAATHSIGHKLGSAAGDSALLDDNGTLASVLGNNTSDSLKGRHVGGAASTNTTVLGGRVDSNKDNVGLADALGHVGGEEQVSRPCGDVGLALGAGLVVE